MIQKVQSVFLLRPSEGLLDLESKAESCPVEFSSKQSFCFYSLCAPLKPDPLKDLCVFMRTSKTKPSFNVFIYVYKTFFVATPLLFLSNGH